MKAAMKSILVSIDQISLDKDTFVQIQPKDGREPIEIQYTQNGEIRIFADPDQVKHYDWSDWNWVNLSDRNKKEGKT